jgi:hypothetical protein
VITINGGLNDKLTLRGDRLRLFENRVLRKVFGLRGTGKWRRLHNDELYDPYSSTDSMWVIKSRRMGREFG